MTKVVNKLRDRPELLERFDYRPPPRAEREPRADEVERLRASRGPLPAALESGEARQTPEADESLVDAVSSGTADPSGADGAPEEEEAQGSALAGPPVEPLAGGATGGEKEEVGEAVEQDGRDEALGDEEMEVTNEEKEGEEAQMSDDEVEAEAEVEAQVEQRRWSRRRRRRRRRRR